MGNTKSNTGKTYSKLTVAKQVIRFLCLFAVAYGILMGWPGFGTAYSTFYRAGAAFLFGSFGSRGIVRFRHLPEDNLKNYIKISFYDRSIRDKNAGLIPIMQLRYGIRHCDYMYVAFMSALIVAGPISWKRRGWALFWGLILIQVFIAFRLALLVLFAFNSKSPSMFALKPFWNSILSLFANVFAMDVFFGFAIAISIWILVSFRREDWSKIAM